MQAPAPESDAGAFACLAGIGYATGMGLVTSTPGERARVEREDKNRRNDRARARRADPSAGLDRANAELLRLRRENLDLHRQLGAMHANLHALFGPGVAPPAGVDREAWDSIRRALLADA